MKCPRCGRQSVDEDAYCGKCGQLLKTSPETLREIVRSELERELSTKYKDQKFLVTETAENVAEKLEKWGKWFLFVTAVPTAVLLAALATLGISSYQQAVAKIATARKMADDLDEKINSTKGRADALATNVGAAEGVAGHAKKTLEDLDRTSSVIEAQLAQIKAKAEIMSGGADLRLSYVEAELAKSRQPGGTVAREVQGAEVVNRAVAEHLTNNDLKPLIAWLRAMGSSVNDGASADDVLNQIRPLGRRAGEDEVFRQQYVAQALKSGLIKEAPTR